MAVEVRSVSEVPTIFLDLGDIPVTSRDLAPCYFCDGKMTPSLLDMKFPSPFVDGRPSHEVVIDAINVPSALCTNRECGLPVLTLTGSIESYRRALEHPLMDRDPELARILRASYDAGCAHQAKWISRS